MASVRVLAIEPVHVSERGMVQWLAQLWAQASSLQPVQLQRRRKTGSRVQESYKEQLQYYIYEILQMIVGYGQPTRVKRDET
jgi:hypothetical protein